MRKENAQQRREIRTDMMGGKGQVELQHVLEKEDAYGAGRNFTINTLAPGCSIGYHQHKGEFEVYYVLEGVGQVVDDGEIYLLRQGDMMQCRDGGSHSIENVGEEPLRVLALILNVAQ